MTSEGGHLARRRTTPGWWVAVALAVTLGAAPADAAESWAGAGLGLGGALAFGVGGGVVTTVMMAPDVVDDRPIHPALRSIAIVCASIDIAFGAAGLIATPFIDDTDYAPVFYSVSGGVLAIGLVTGGFALAADTYDPHARSRPPVREGLYLSPTPGGAAAAWVGRF